MLTRLVVIAVLAVAAMSTTPAEAQQWVTDTFLRADLHGDDAIQGHVRWGERHLGRDEVDLLIVKLWGAEPHQELDVYINDVFLDSIAANENGEMYLYRQDPDIVAPEKFGSVRVGHMTGIFFDRHPETPQATIQRYIARTRTYDDGVSALFRYHERLRNRNIIRHLTVDVAGQFDEPLDVRLNGMLIARIEPPSGDLDPGQSPSSGSRRSRTRVVRTGGGLPVGLNGSLALRSEWAIREDDRAQPFPDWIPAPLPGDVITVGTASNQMIRVDWKPPVH